MAQRIVGESGFELSKSYDLGIHYTYRNLLADNHYRVRFFRQWLARFDTEEVGKHYDYNTGKGVRRGNLAPTEIHYDQIQWMIYNANLPVQIENDLFYFLDYHLNRDNKTVDFLKVKELFAFCGVDGVYDLESGKHRLMTYDPPFTVDNLNVEKWEAEDREKNRPLLARMMAAPGEVPNNKERIAELNLEHNMLWVDHFEKTETHRKLEDIGTRMTANAEPGIEGIVKAVRDAKKNGFDMDMYDHEIDAFNEWFYKTPESLEFARQIDELKKDEEEKLARAMEKYASHAFLENPNRYAEYDKNLGKFGRKWEQQSIHEMNDKRKWAFQYVGHSTPDTISNEPPTEEELAQMRPNLAAQEKWAKARLVMWVEEFEKNKWPQVRSRYCAIEDWILREYTLSPLNKGVIAEVRREDIPVLFKEALRAELEDGLLTRLQFPIRVERLNDGTDNCKLVFHGHDVEIFHPAEVLPDYISQFAPPELKTITPDDNIVDFKLHSPTKDKSNAPLPGDERAQRLLEQERLEQARQDEELRERARLARMLNEEQSPEVPSRKRHLLDEYSRQQDPRGQRARPGKSMKSLYDPTRLPQRQRFGGGGMSGGNGIDINIGLIPESITQKTAKPAQLSPALQKLEAFKSGRTQLEAAQAAGQPGTESQWKDMKKAINNLATDVQSAAKTKTSDAKDRLKDIGRELRQSIKLFTQAVMGNPKVGKIAEQCKKMVQQMIKAVTDLLQAIQGLFMGSPSRA